MKKENIYLVLSILAASALATSKVRKEFRQKKFDDDIRGKIKYTKKVLILGDSVASGYGTKIGGITKSLQEKMNIHFENLVIENLGIDGLTTKGLLEKIESRVWDKKIKESDLIIMNIGGNDLLRMFNEAGPKGVIKNFPQVRSNFSKNIRAIVNELKGINPNTMIFMNELYDSMDKKNQFYGLSKIMITIWNSASSMENVVKVKTKIMKHKNGYWIDLVHPNEDGYEEMGDLIYQEIYKYLK